MDDTFIQAHPEMPVHNKSDSPDKDKSVGDSFSLKPVLSDFFALHLHFHPDTFLGDSAFDTIDTYGFLKKESLFPGLSFLIIPEMKAALKKSDTIFMAIPLVPKTPLSI